MTTPAVRRELRRDPTFRAHDQATIALFVAQLDDQSRRLTRDVASLGVADLEGQPAPGRNSVGMLLAHIAITEVFWIGVATGTTPDREPAERLCHEILGIGQADDGMPAPADGGHPAALAGWEVERYLDLLQRARRYLKTVTSSWTDADLAATTIYRDHEPDREWTLYHLLEHYAQHAGQIGLVLALRRHVS